MQKYLIPVAFGTSVLAAALPVFADRSPFNTHSQGVMTIAAYGDSPYGTTPSDTSQTDATPAFIDFVNADPEVSLVMHVGDIHSGKQFCTEAYDRQVADLWTAFQHPVVYTPGDNEWADCHKVAEGGGLYDAGTGQIKYVVDANNVPVDFAGGDPMANLNLVRQIFFAHPGYTLGDPKRVLSQAEAFTVAADAAFVENVMFEQSRTLFVTIDVPGGSNNDKDVWYGTPSTSAAQSQEKADRTAADLRWLDAAFDRAQADGAGAVVIMAQADMWDPEKGAGHLTEYESIIAKVAARTLAFGKPVLMLNGDSHVYQSRNPMHPVASSDPGYLVYSMHPGYDVPNFHRIVVHGSTFPLEWLKIRINPRANAANGPDAFGPFSWTRMIQQ